MDYKTIREDSLIGKMLSLLGALIMAVSFVFLIIIYPFYSAVKKIVSFCEGK